MKKSILQYLLFHLLLLAYLDCTAQKLTELTENERLVVDYINARNSYDVDNLKILVAENYNEIDFEGNIILEDREQLIGNVLWGKELASHTKIIQFNSTDNKVVTKSTFSNYMDEVLERKPRTLLVTHTIENGKLLSEKIDTLSGYDEIERYNREKMAPFLRFCEEQQLISPDYRLDQPEYGKQFRAALDKYKALGLAVSQNSKKKIKEMNTEKDYPKALSSFDDFKNLVSEVEPYREKRLIDLDEFLKMSQDENVIILDTRSTFRYNRKHLKGAIHLSFTDFTQQALWELIPDPETKILIYCNNNFDGDPIDFASKISIPGENKNIESQILSNRKPMMLALNIPTFINLYGYGYRNIYELDELVNINDPRVKFEGTEVKNNKL